MSAAILVLLSILFVYALIRMKSVSQPSLTPAEAAKAVASGEAVIIDVREPMEWSAGVAEPAVLLPLGDLKGLRTLWAPFLKKNGDKRLLLYCQAGMRAGLASTLLVSEGYKAENLGGFTQWVKSGLPIRSP